MKKLKKLPVKVGDIVKIISGSYKNKTGEILKISSKTGKIIVKNINLKIKHVKPQTKETAGKIVQFEAPLHHSNVKIN